MVLGKFCCAQLMNAGSVNVSPPVLTAREERGGLDVSEKEELFVGNHGTPNAGGDVVAVKPRVGGGT